MTAYPDMFSLAGRTAVITGAGSGLGAVIAEAMTEAGAAVADSDIDTGMLDKTASRLKKMGGKVLARRCDVTSEEQVEQMVQAAVSEFGTIDILFNNAGIGDPEPGLLHEYSTGNWDKVLDINLRGIFLCSRAVLKIMAQQGSGKIINMASMWGLAGTSSVFPLPAYAASKGAVVNLTREMALQYAPLGINVNAICPGFFRTRLGPYDDPEFVKAITDFTPAGRIAEADEMKGTAIYLASSASDFAHGLLLVIDGGCAAK